MAIKEPPERLVEQLKLGNVVVVAGAGVTAATVPNDQRPMGSWMGLVRSGLERCQKLEQGDEDAQQQIDLFLRVLDKKPPVLDRLIAAASYVRTVLSKAGEFAGWLNGLSKLEIANTGLIQTMLNLSCPIITTNYDDLIHRTAIKSGFSIGPGASWDESAASSAIVNKEYNRILHIHGIYSRPQSVILSEEDYGRISANHSAQGILNAILRGRTVLFVGCNDTVNDPNWKPLLQKITAAFVADGQQSEHKHYLLHLDPNKLDGQIQFWNYGDSYDDLPLFLNELARQAGKTPAQLAPAPAQASQPQKKTWDESLTRYKEAAQAKWGITRALSMAKPMPVDDIFTQVYVYEGRLADQLAKKEVLENQGRRSSHKQGKRKDVYAVVKRQRMLYVVGAPGAGKTTFLQHLLLSAIKGKFPEIPILLPLRDWWAQQPIVGKSAPKTPSAIVQTLKNFMISELRQRTNQDFMDAEQFLETALSEGTLMVLFDGLDEIQQQNNQRSNVIKAIEELIANYPQNRFVLSCRTAASDYMFGQTNFYHVEVADFDDKQIKTFVGKWFGSAKAKAKGLLSEIEKEYGIGEMASSPLLLALLCLVYERHGKLYARRSEIYAEALNTLLAKRDSEREIERDEIYRGLQTGRKQDLLAELAYPTFKTGTIVIPTQKAADYIEVFLRGLPVEEAPKGLPVNKGLGKFVLEQMEAQHGIVKERLPGYYAFSHLTFHEFYTARAIMSDSSKLSDLLDQAHDDRWREVIKFVASELSGESARQFLVLWEDSLRQKIKEQPILADFFAAAAEGLDFNPITRAYAIAIRVRVFAINAFGRGANFKYEIDSEVAHSLAFVLSPAFALDSHLNRDLNRDLALVLDRAFELPHGIDYDRGVAYAHARALNLNLKDANPSAIISIIDTNVVLFIALELRFPGKSSEEINMLGGRLAHYMRSECILLQRKQC
jgi:energy-coupling factor transporter ATP-binding protein EcfA2